MEEYRNTVIQGDCLEELRKLPDGCLDMCMTSPPYWGLRDYGVDQIFGGDKKCDHKWESKETEREFHQTGAYGRGDPKTLIHKSRYSEGVCIYCGAWKGQLGLEPTPDMYIEHMTEIFHEIKRALKNTGTLWLNIGDTYGGSGGDHKEWHKNDAGFQGKLMRGSQSRTLLPKCLIMIPERLSWVLIQDGWTLRNKIVWIKANSMPSSVKDRLSNKWEYVYLFSKARRYYFDLDAIRDPVKQESIDRHKRGVSETRKYADKSHYGGGGGLNKPRLNIKKSKSKYSDLEEEKMHRQGLHVQRGDGIVEKRDLPDQKEFVKKLRENFTINEIVEKTKLQRTLVEHWFRNDECFSYPAAEDWKLLKTDLFPGLTEIFYESDDVSKSNHFGKNPGDIWVISTKGFPGAHFAVFPEKLCEKPIKAGCPEEICKKCGKARERIIKPTKEYKKHLGRAWHDHEADGMQGQRITRKVTGAAYVTAGWTDCGCGAGFEPGIVLDPFAGAGTVLLVAKEMRRDYLGIEIKKEYCEMIKKRLSQGVLR